MEFMCLFIFYLFILVLLFSANYVNSERSCSHYKLNKIKKLAGNNYIPAVYDKLDDWQPIRILPEYSGLVSKEPKSIKLTEAIKTKIIPKTIQVFQQLLKVRRLKQITLTEGKCTEDYPIPINVFGNDNPKETDLIVLVNYDKTGDFQKYKVEASAIHCFQDQKTKRPIVGLISFRDDLEIKTDVDIDYLVWLALHEISHILLFNDDLYKDFIDLETLNPIDIKNVIKTTQNQFNQRVDTVITKHVVEKARKHFNCKTLEGVPLEYNGGENSTGGHWSRKALNTDYMIGRSHGENLISDISLAFFQDSGWYKVDYSKANMFHWGKNKGCKFFSQDCVKKNVIIRNFIKTLGRENQSEFAKKVKKFRQEAELKIETTIMKVETYFKKEYCEELNQPVCSMHNTFRGYCGARKFNRILPKQDQNFLNARIGGYDNFVNRCPIVIENKFSQKYYGGSCKWGSKEDLSSYEKICHNCGCFVSSLSKKPVHSGKSNGQLSHEEETAFDLTVYSKPQELHSKAACLEFECAKGEVFIKIDGKKKLCPSNKDISVDGYQGKVKCPDKAILCDKKYFCKFGCTNVK